MGLRSQTWRRLNTQMGREFPKELRLMSDTAVAPGAVPAPLVIPLREWAPYAIFAGVVLLFLIYIVGCEQGATSLLGGHYLHEWVHDGRHLLGFPCH
jgi:hypothetical protein